ncbi:Undecaprenyl-phosphate 4-deoxy-4-formamido-L-arabinose transferase [Methylobacterium crusticola]|uniref:Undecaprenyl-phosphate 4-deoxy-4-formamido-L-arabinose transferase n=1 Tax=Methylobacterium crusticola TaxID=1697972 RepID=A0ABQ4QXE0_9HYPH|nr:glycosyltransferase family 2 protein [Methylobacterium crusticola]GJD50023.1 Undecaprenyl-phosphate 4-deoxy-4-formamido-L-arabinose transferase [Methylobacterium crusticola]
MSYSNLPSGLFPFVSIVVPAYNAERFIARTLDSALAQDYASTEIIVVDDGSTDRTAEIVESYRAADARIRLISTENQGVAAARNTGIAASRGSLVAFLDADDLWARNKLRLQVGALQDNPAAAAAYVWSIAIDEDDGVIAPLPNWQFDGFSLCRHLLTWPVGNGSALLVRKEAALAVRGYDSEYRRVKCGGAEDLDFELRLAELFQMVCVPQVLVGYRNYPGNMSSDRERMARAGIMVIERALGRNPNIPARYANWIRAKVFRYAAESLRDERALRSAYHYLVMVWLDGRLGLELAAGFGRKIIGRLKRLTAGREARLTVARARDGIVPVPFSAWIDANRERATRLEPDRRVAMLETCDRRLGGRRDPLAHASREPGREVSASRGGHAAP